MKTKSAYIVWITLHSTHFNVSSVNLKEIKEFRNQTHIILMLPIRLSDYRAVGLAIGPWVTQAA